MTLATPEPPTTTEAASADEPRIGFRGDPSSALTRILFLGGFLLLLAHSFVPILEFVHRGDDAYYYFKVAVNDARLGRWTFDGIHSTNGVQPLWGFVLAQVAKLLLSCGVTDLDSTARIFVGLTAVAHWAGCLLLFKLLARYVSFGVGIAAAGALLFPMGMVWTRVWGMENSFYGLLLVASVFHYQRGLRQHGTTRNAIVLGLLLGLTVLARLNAGFFVLCLLGHHVLRRCAAPRLARLRGAILCAAVVGVVVLPVLVSSFLETGHALPVAGGAKLIRAKWFLARNEVDSVFSWHFLGVLYDWAWRPLRWWLSSRAIDGTWLLGGRLLHTEQVSMGTLGYVLAGLLAAPLCFLGPARWLKVLAERARGLRPFGYVLAFAALNAAVSLAVFPYEANYSIIRWWLVEGEITVAVLMATLVASCVGVLGARFLPPAARWPAATIGVALLVGGHLVQMGRFYWDGVVQYPDWNRSNNEVRYAAALWIRDHLPPEARIGSWNAGVVGYYSDRQVVNLDGLINDWNFLTYLESGELAEYLEQEGIRYLADTNLDIRERGGAPLRGRLDSRSLFRRSVSPEGKWPGFLDVYFHIYEILNFVPPPVRSLAPGSPAPRGSG